MSSLDHIRQQLHDAAAAFATDAKPLAELLELMLDDVGRALVEPLLIFPVCHHSPASALHMAQRLRQAPPKIIFMEGCEDMMSVLPQLRECRLPIALQAFALDSNSFPVKWMPLNCILPLTEFSAEFQVIAYCMTHPETELYFVDRSTDHVFQWMPQDENELEDKLAAPGEDDSGDDESPQTKNAPGGSALVLQVGATRPSFADFEHFLLRNARVRSFQEWWEQYVEAAVLGADFATYREVMLLVGSLLRRLGRATADVDSDRRREQYMWTRIKEKLAEKKIAPRDAMWVCGAIHGVSDVEEFGTHSDKVWSIPAKSDTRWQYGLIPASYASIERQFGHPAGTISLAESTWAKSMKALNIKPFRLEKSGPEKKPAKNESAKAAIADADETDEKEESNVPIIQPGVKTGDEILESFFSKPPVLIQQDEEQLLRWCVDLVNLARKNGYLSSTADAIAVYHTSKLLAGLRNRLHPTANDFTDAAITCVEKDRVPGKRDVTKLCQIILGGDRTGVVGYGSLPKLAQDIYDRLKPLGLKLTQQVERALIDYKKHPELLPCSDLLWMLHFLLGDIARPVMGQRKLGEVPIQESWDLSIGRNQRAIIELAYEGVILEHVIEKRLRASVNEPNATAVTALAACENSLLYLKSERLTEDLGNRALSLVELDPTAHDAPEVFTRVRRLVAYYRSTKTGLPKWIKNFVVTGYTHYTSVLPEAFSDRGTKPEQVAGMLAFVFTLESLALSLGCSRSQLVIAIGQASSRTDDPTKQGLLWAAEWLLGLRAVEQIRASLDSALANPLMLPAFPGYISGFLLALGFTPLVARIVVELISKAFERLPEEVLVPWLPSLMLLLRAHGADLFPLVLKEVGNTFPKGLTELKAWQAPWEQLEEPSESSEATDTDSEQGESTSENNGEAIIVSPIGQLLRQQRTAPSAIAAHLGETGAWVEPVATLPAQGEKAEVKAKVVKNSGATEPLLLLQKYPTAMNEIAKLID